MFSIRQKIEAANFYTYEARFIPDRPEDDAMPQNNRATAFTHVQGKGQVLLIEDYEHPGEFAVLVDRLRRQGLEVEVQPSNQLFTTLADLQPYDTVLLANVPREQFSDGQIAMLARNTQQMGAGLVMLGGPNSFGAGGWTNTEVEKAMPVDFQIKSAKVVPRGALAMIMHASEIAEGNYWQKVIAKEAIKALGPQDYCGVIHWSGTSQWLWGRGLLQVGAEPRPDAGPARPHDARRHARLRSDDGPGRAAASPQLPDAAVKHLIIISDGDPSPPSGGTITALKNAERDGLDRRRRRPRAGRQPDAVEHRRGHRREVLRGEQRQQPAADLPARGPPRRPAADLGQAARCSRWSRCPRTKSSAASTARCRRSPATC